jgi:hypothetical protein
MTFSGSAAIHAFILVHSHQASGDSIDLDIVAIWPILAIGAVTVVPILMWSPIARKSAGIPIIVYWGILNWLSAASIVLAIWVLSPNIGQDICRATDNGDFLLSPYQKLYEPAKFDCTYSCFETGTRLRSPNEALILEGMSANGYPAALGLYDRLFIFIAVVIFVQPIQMFYTWLYLQDRDLRGEWLTSLDNALGEGKSLISFFKAWAYHLFCSAMVVLSCIDIGVFIATIVLSELYFVKAEFKSGDEWVSVGEWSGFVTVALVLAGLGLMELHKRRRRRQQ